jgi:hypothetical protein
MPVEIYYLNNQCIYSNIAIAYQRSIIINIPSSQICCDYVNIHQLFIIIRAIPIRRILLSCAALRRVYLLRWEQTIVMSRELTYCHVLSRHGKKV